MRTGYSLVEALAAIALGSLVAMLMATTLSTHGRMASDVARRSEIREATALAAALLPTETRDADRADLGAVAGDSLALRAFRATAVVCDTAADHATVRWRGSRTPDADKDSAIVLGGPQEVVVPLLSPVASADCPAHGQERVYRIGRPVPMAPGDVLLVFERGSYHISTHALRWRAGAAGRQPLTAEIFDDARSTFTGAPAELRLYTRSLHMRDPVVEVRIPLRSRNGSMPP